MTERDHVMEGCMRADCTDLQGLSGPRSSPFSGKCPRGYSAQLHIFFLLEQTIHERREKGALVQIRPGGVISTFP